MGLTSDNSASKKGGDWAFRSEALRLLRACLQCVNKIEESEIIRYLQPQDEKAGDAGDYVLSSDDGSASAQAQPSNTVPSTTTKANICRALRKRVGVLFPSNQCLPAAMDARLALPIRSVLLDLVRLQIFSNSDESTSPSAATTQT